MKLALKIIVPIVVLVLAVIGYLLWDLARRVRGGM
jgi:hypothetical protein